MQNTSTGYYWWFGINNKDEKNRQPGDHVIYRPKFELFINGILGTYLWPQNIKNHQMYYEEMQIGDSILFWMGDGDFPNWGIIGFGFIDDISKKADGFEYKLKLSNKLLTTIKPYENGNPKETNITDFLVKEFGYNFGPLYKNFIQIDSYKKKITKTPPIAITIEKINKSQYKGCLDHSLLLNEDLSIL